MSCMESILKMQNELRDILGEDISLYLYGSVPLEDFRLGWSDIDILCLGAQPFSEQQLERLVMLRQTLLEKEPDHLYYRSFEGWIVPQCALSDPTCAGVYWGTSGQRIVKGCQLDVFARYELRTTGVLLYGQERLSALPVPTYHALWEGIRTHCDCIQKYASKTSNPLYICGWMLDIARCLYTLHTGKVVSKTTAAKWAIQQHLCPTEDTLRQVIRVRENPTTYKNDATFAEWASGIQADIQAFADRLEQKLNQTEHCVTAECSEDSVQI